MRMRPTVDVLQACEHAQGGGLTAAGGADEDEELTVRNVEAQLVDSRLIGTGVHAGRVIEGYACHVQFLPTGRYVPDDPLWGDRGASSPTECERGSFRARD